MSAPFSLPDGSIQIASLGGANIGAGPYLPTGGLRPGARWLDIGPSADGIQVSEMSVGTITDEMDHGDYTGESRVSGTTEVTLSWALSLRDLVSGVRDTIANLTLDMGTASGWDSCLDSAPAAGDADHMEVWVRVSWTQPSGRTAWLIFGNCRLTATAGDGPIGTMNCSAVARKPSVYVTSTSPRNGPIYAGSTP